MTYYYTSPPLPSCYLLLFIQLLMGENTNVGIAIGQAARISLCNKFQQFLLFSSSERDALIKWLSCGKGMSRLFLCDPC